MTIQGIPFELITSAFCFSTRPIYLALMVASGFVCATESVILGLILGCFAWVGHVKANTHVFLAWKVAGETLYSWDTTTDDKEVRESIRAWRKSR